jgi:hypothetical protein
MEPDRLLVEPATRDYKVFSKYRVSKQAVRNSNRSKREPKPVFHWAKK